jgi:predicted ATP-grasp superfamily ATP-dependent carboligase
VQTGAFSARPRVLVVGIAPALTWKVARCLMNVGCRPTVLGWHRFSPMQFMPGIEYVHWQGVRWIDDDLDPELVIQIESECSSRGLEAVMAADYPSTMLLAQCGARIRSAALVDVPDEDTIRLLHNKWTFSQLLTRLEIPQPQTEMARDGNDLVQTNLSFPIITKPVDRWASVGFEVHADRDVLVQKVRQGQLGADFPLLVQEFIPGQDMGFAFIARGGRIQSYTAFEHPKPRVRRHFHSSRLLDHVSKIVSVTGYSGVGEVDARYDPVRDEYRLLEVNPRFWASVLYSARAGMNFPDLLLRPPRDFKQLGFVAQSQSVGTSIFERSAVASLMLAERFFHWMED